MVPKTNLRLSDSLKEPTELNKIVILRITVFAIKGYRLKINNGKKAYKADEGQASSCLLPGKSHRQNFIFPARVCMVTAEPRVRLEAGSPGAGIELGSTGAELDPGTLEPGLAL